MARRGSDFIEPNVDDSDDAHALGAGMLLGLGSLQQPIAPPVVYANLFAAATAAPLVPSSQRKRSAEVAGLESGKHASAGVYQGFAPQSQAQAYGQPRRAVAYDVLDVHDHADHHDADAAHLDAHAHHHHNSHQHHHHHHQQQQQHPHPQHAHHAHHLPAALSDHDDFAPPALAAAATDSGNNGRQRVVALAVRQPVDSSASAAQQTAADFAASLMSLASASTAAYLEDAGAHAHLLHAQMQPAPVRQPRPVSVPRPPRDRPTGSRSGSESVAFRDLLGTRTTGWSEEMRRRYSAQWFRDGCVKKWNLQFCPHENCLMDVPLAEDLVEHVLTFEARDQTKCLYCPYVQGQNIRKHKLRTHLQRHFLMPFRCKCGMTYAQREGFHKHLRKRGEESGHGLPGASDESS